MGIAVKHIWDFYERHCGGDRDNDKYKEINEKQKIIVAEYKKIRDWEDKNLKTDEKWKDSLHYHRRLVTHFYRNLAYLRFSWIICLTKRKIKRIFSGWDMRILGILCPIEIRHIINGDDGKIHKSTLYLFKLYKKSQQWISLDICLKQFKRRNPYYLRDN